ncbi:MAG: peptidoglycan domain protein [Muribaculaceae bacterium]|nr:peptidoglycan domain protein [Muribaculaceae bacterium]
MLDKFLLFLLNAEAGVKIKSHDEIPLLVFEKARKTGWSDDPRDLGGATMCGITLKTFSAWCIANKLPLPTKDILRAITFQTWKAVVQDLFWLPYHADKIITPQIAYIITDWIWASGPAVIKHVQRLVGVAPDGIVGPHTIRAINSADQQRLFFDIKQRRIQFINDICAARSANNVFRKGWINRLNRIIWNPPYLKFQ